jgi:hypothetical protein
MLKIKKLKRGKTVLLDWCVPEWDSYTKCMSIATVDKALSNSTSNGKSNFARIRKMVIHRIIHTSVLAYRRMMSETTHTSLTKDLKIQDLWESFLTDIGLLPPIRGKGSYVREVFGFLRDGIWHEWNIPDLHDIRAYWDLICLGNPDTLVLLMTLLLDLPGCRETCSSCRWVIPESGMHESSICITCSNQTLYKISAGKRKFGHIGNEIKSVDSSGILYPHLAFVY